MLLVGFGLEWFDHVYVAGVDSVDGYRIPLHVKHVIIHSLAASLLLHYYVNKSEFCY
jgi:hypothetical protein